jgi:predicted amidophosphoribosyltransferase
MAIVRARGSLGQLGDLILPRTCVGCSSSGHALCPSCAGDGEPFEVAPPPISHDRPTFAAGVYDDGLRAAVVAYKERGRRDLSPVLAALLGVAVSSVADENTHDLDRASVVLVAVPSSRAASRARGGAHLPRLVRRVAREYGTATVPGLLHLQRAVRDSVGLSVAERVENVAGAMAATAGPPPGAAALIVDDIVTTGATLAEAARALQVAGWPVIGAAVIAAALRHDGAHPDPGAGRAADVLSGRMWSAS